MGEIRVLRDAAVDCDCFLNVLNQGGSQTIPEGCANRSALVAQRALELALGDFLNDFWRIDSEASLNSMPALKVGGSEDRQDRQV
jgi:hypothetical protein